MKIEQRVDPGLRDRADVAQHVGRRGVVPLRGEVEVDALQPVGDRPAEQRTPLARGSGDLRERLEKARLVLRLDDDEGGAGLEE